MSSLESETEVEVEKMGWKELAVHWLVHQSFSVIVSIALLFGIWHIATDIAPSHFGKLMDRQAEMLGRAVYELNESFDKRTADVISMHERDRELFKSVSEQSDKDRTLMIELLREQLRLTKLVENKMP